MKVSKEDFLSYRTVLTIFTNLPIILDWSKWPQTNEKLINFGDDEIEALKLYLMPLLEKKIL